MHIPAVDAYLAVQPAAHRTLLERISTTVRNVCPAATEVVAYGMPGYRLDGRLLLTYAGYKRHCAIYPATERLKAALGDELAPYLAEKSTIRIAPDHPMPDALLRRIVELLAEERGDSKAG